MMRRLLGWIVLIVTLAILAPWLPLKDPDQNFVDICRLRALPCARVLTTTRTYNQYLHQCRKCRMPVKTMARPCSFAA